MFAHARVAAAVIGVAAAVVLVGCVPEPEASPTSATAAVTASPTPTSPSPSSSSSPSSSAIPAFAVPADCDAIYSSAMTATLEGELSPLNDPGVTLLSSQNARALEALDSGAPTLRCSWGTPSESGLSTNVSRLDDVRSQAVKDALVADGFDCMAESSGTVCRLEKETIDFDDNVVVTGEVHYFRGEGWVATSYVGGIPDGYTADIVGTVWG